MERGSDNRIFALRGAISVDRNDKESILAATHELLSELIARNRLKPELMVSCILTATPDLNAEFPAVAARALGLQQVPLLCTQEIDVPGSLPRCIRVLLHYYAGLDHNPKHTYLKEAKSLRSDLEAAQ